MNALILAAALLGGGHYQQQQVILKQVAPVQRVVVRKQRQPVRKALRVVTAPLRLRRERIVVEQLNGCY